MLWMMLQKYGIIPVEDVDKWLFIFSLNAWATDFLKRTRQAQRQ